MRADGGQCHRETARRGSGALLCADNQVGDFFSIQRCASRCETKQPSLKVVSPGAVNRTVTPLRRSNAQ
jgi:hypothetical protein